MTKKSIKEKYSCFIFGEGRKDKNFLITLFDLTKFKYHTRKWIFSYGNGHGESPKEILKKCHRESSLYSFDLTLCFIDLDKLKGDFPKTKDYSHIKIIWQIDNAEDEYKKGSIKKQKNKLKNL
jgi:hypothetical protein